MEETKVHEHLAVITSNIPADNNADRKEKFMLKESRIELVIEHE